MNTTERNNNNSQSQQQHKLAKKIKNFIYNPNDMIGSGFSSQVFKGINQNTIEPIAIKVIQLAKIQNQVQKYLLNNQITALRSLNHKNVLHTVDILMTKNNVYIVTQFCQDGDLFKKIEKVKKMRTYQPKNNIIQSVIPQFDALCIIKDVLQGYLALQQKKILHRDLKTANIFLSKGSAKIADFGFCQVQTENSKKPQIAYNVGSPAYMSPQSYKDNHYSNKSDIWSIGIILYQMLIGQTPDKTQTYDKMASNLMQGKIKNIANEQIKSILTKCFKRNLKQRIDCKGMLDAVHSQLRKMQGRMGFGGSMIINKTNGFSNHPNPNLNTVRHSQILPSNQQNPFNPINEMRQSQNGLQFIQNNIEDQRHFGMKKNNNSKSQTHYHTVQQFRKSGNNIPIGNINTNINNNNIGNQKPILQNNFNPGSTRNQQLKKSNTNENIHHVNNHMHQQNQQNSFRPSAQSFFTHQRKRSKSPQPLSQQTQNSKKYFVSDGKPNNLKPSIQILLFLYRLLKFVSETSILQAQLTRLILFRHRSFIDQTLPVTNLNDETYRQFQYLRSKFDETYLQKQFNHNPSHKTIITLNQLTNSQFTNKETLKIYEMIFNEGCQSCQNYIYGNGKVQQSTIDFNKVGIMWDYLILQIQILVLIGEGRSPFQIVQMMNLNEIMKDQPKRLMNNHYQLLKLKNKLITHKINETENQFRPFTPHKQERSSKKSLIEMNHNNIQNQEMTKNNNWIGRNQNYSDQISPNFKPIINY